MEAILQQIDVYRCGIAAKQAGQPGMKSVQHGEINKQIV